MIRLLLSKQHWAAISRLRSTMSRKYVPLPVIPKDRPR
jgi:hypothetical protein